MEQIINQWLVIPIGIFLLLLSVEKLVEIIIMIAQFSESRKIK